MTISYFQELADYNIWANTIVAQWLDKITEGQWSMPITSSFGSIAITTVHIASAEKIWLDRLMKVKSPIWLQSGYVGTKLETIELLLQGSQNLKSFLSTKDSTDLNKIFEFKRINGEPYAMLYYQALAHVFNHSTYHRGQILTMLRQVGFDQVGSTDMLGYFRIK